MPQRKYNFKHLQYYGEEGKLIPLLQKAQEKDGYLTPESMTKIHEETGIPISQIYGVATFYAQFRMTPVGKNLIKVCHGTACHVSKAHEISNTIEEMLEINDGETTKDMNFTLETVSCLGCCSLAPVMMINDKTYGNLEPKEVKKIIKHYRDGENK